MPTFTFTSPEGKSYSVDGPEGSTSEQAYGVLQQQLAAKAPTQTAAPEKQTLGSATKEIGKSTIAGGVLGALAPEIVTGIGMASALIPVVGEVTAPALIATGQALRGARLAEAAAGALSGAVSETAGQVADARGARKGTATAVRLGAGLLSPGAAMSAKFVSGPIKTLWSAVQHIAGGGEKATPAVVNAAREKLAALADAGKPQLSLHAALQEGVAADAKAADAAAANHLAEAHAAADKLAATDAAGAQRLVEEARSRSDMIRAEAAQRAEVLNKATDSKLATAKKVYALTQPELAKVGTPRELSDIGNELKANVTAAQKAETDSRNAAYQSTVKERDATVAAKENAGQTVDQLPAMKELKQVLSTKLLNTAPGRKAAAGLAQVTEPGVKSAYQRVYDSIINKRVQTGLDESGAPKFETFKTSFDALDHVRRKLGDVVAGKDTEGYIAIGKGIAQNLYRKIAKIQEDFAGAAQGKLQGEYADATTELQRFESKAGKKVADIDPKDLPKQFFSSQQGVKTLRELAGNNEIVNRAASDYAARSLDGMSAKQAAKWGRENSEWTREVPGLQAKVNSYATKTEQIERTGAKLTDRAEKTATAASDVKTAGQKLADKEYQAAVDRASKASEGSVAAQQRLRDEGAKQAESLKKDMTAASGKLDTILKGGEAPEAARSLLLSGKPEVTRLAARTLAGVPGGQRVLEDSVRQTLRNMSEKNLNQQWTERVLPMLRDGQMIPPQRLAALQQDVERVLQAHQGKSGLTGVQRLIGATLGVVGGQGVKSS